MEAVVAVLGAAKEWAFPVSGLLLCLYPLGILMWTVAEGTSAAVTAKKSSSGEETPSPKSLESETAALQTSYSTEPQKEKRRAKGRSHGTALATALAAVAVLVLLGVGAAFACLARGARDARRSSHVADADAGARPFGPVPAEVAPLISNITKGSPVGPGTAHSIRSGTITAVAGALVVAGVAAALRAAQRRTFACCEGRSVPVLAASASAMGGAQTGRSGTVQAPAPGVPRYSPPPVTGISLWHDVDLHVKTWLDEDTGLYHYVNEMPLGCLQKFEVQPHLPENAVEEDPKGSKRLAAFGRPVPFNYGCFPQTFRDPDCKDELYGAPGDNDPLDVLDLATGVVGVGEVVRCRPLGAVCLIDEGQADWKILAVNVDIPGALAAARSIEDVHRIAPGRISECLQWIDDFKHSSGKSDASLDFKVHDASTALRLIEEDHVSWQQLLQEVGADGTARGHWVRAPKRPAMAQQLPPLRPQPLKLRWPPSCTVPGQPPRASAPWPLVGASPVVAAARRRSSNRVLIPRRHDGHAASSDA